MKQASDIFDGLPDGSEFTGGAGWKPISTAPKDGTKIVAWLVPNEVNMPNKAKPLMVSWQVKQFKDGLGAKVGDPFGIWESDGRSNDPMSFAPTLWMPVPTNSKETP